MFGGDNELIEYVQLACGLCLLGVQRRVLFILYGKGANGKSTFLNVLRRVLVSDYTRQTCADMLMTTGRSRDGEGATPERARLRGARLVCATETEEGHRLNEGLVKAMTGGENLQDRGLYKDSFEFKPQFKILLATNHKPTVKGTDQAIWERIKRIPFEARFTRDSGQKPDPELGEKLSAEADGIFAWAGEGCRKFQERERNEGEGLPNPKAVDNAVKGYRKEMDVVGDFIAEMCNTAPEFDVECHTLYQAYENWAEANGHDVLKPKRLDYV